MKAIKKPIVIDFEFAEEDGEIETLEGKFSYKKGDAIITGVKGEKYPCRRDIFDQTYLIVSQDAIRGKGK
ncbi:MAG: PGDYG domain-containing protein [Candidatus Thermoplasmatota archaeon]|nr:PGDYG domain-containing protein [Candidatus Thermoplasmatota archaeon]